MGYIVRSKLLDVGLVVSDAKTIRQAKAAFRRYLRAICIPSREFYKYMSNIDIKLEEDTDSNIYIGIK
jgi:hypothetical protein